MFVMMLGMMDFMFTGYAAPVEAMPEFLQLFANLIPAPSLAKDLPRHSAEERWPGGALAQCAGPGHPGANLGIYFHTSDPEGIKLILKTANNTPAPAVRVDGLIKQFGDFTAVAGIDFHVDYGEIFGFLGPNGSGKTTTIRMLLGLLQATAGNIDVLGYDVRQDPYALRKRVGYMSQHFNLYNDLTVLENLRFTGRVYGLNGSELDERIRFATGMADLVGRENEKTRNLSGGWRQRLALSAAILHEPDLLFLDEPTAGVDPVSRRTFWDLLYVLADQGTTIFVTTHYMDEAEHCHRLAFIQFGHITSTGTPQEIKDNFMQETVLELNCSDPAAGITTLKNARDKGAVFFEEAALYGSSLHIVGPMLTEQETLIRTLLVNNGIECYSIEEIQPSLEDVFISVMRNNHEEKDFITSKIKRTRGVE